MDGLWESSPYRPWFQGMKSLESRQRAFFSGNTDYSGTENSVPAYPLRSNCHYASTFQRAFRYSSLQHMLSCRKGKGKGLITSCQRLDQGYKVPQGSDKRDIRRCSRYLEEGVCGTRLLVFAQQPRLGKSYAATKGISLESDHIERRVRRGVPRVHPTCRLTAWCTSCTG